MNNKYEIEDVVYIVDVYKVIKCRIVKIIQTVTDITYELISDDFHKYTRLEKVIFKNIEKANKWLSQYNLRCEMNTLEVKVSDYQGWVNDLDYAIQHYGECETDIEIRLKSNQTNGKDKVLFAVTSTGTKVLLENIRKYFKEQLDIKEKELKEIQEKLDGDYD